MDCEKCGGEVYDNTRKNQERADRGEKPMPQFKCKDKDGCGWVKWGPKPKARAPKGGNGISGGNSTGRERWTWGDLFAAYEACHKRIVQSQGEKATPESINAGVATLLITAEKLNLPGPQTALKRAEAIKAAEAAAKKQKEEAVDEPPFEDGEEPF